MAKVVVDAMAMQRALTRITYEIIERNKGIDDLIILGIKTRGIYLAQRIASRLKQLENATVPVGELDVSKYRDDIEHDSQENDPKVTVAKIDFPITDKKSDPCGRCPLHRPNNSGGNECHHGSGSATTDQLSCFS